MSVISSSRHMQLLGIVKKQQKVSVADLTLMLNVSPATIRRDLLYLHSKDLLVRRHGYAISNAAQNQFLRDLPERSFADKGILHVKEKIAIAKKAQDLLCEDDILFINSGSTTLCFMEHIKNKQVSIFTNNACAVNVNLDTNIGLFVLGGEYRKTSCSFVGLMVVDAIANIHSSKTFLGVNGLDVHTGITTSAHQECSVNQAMIENTNQEVIVLADYSKIGLVANFVSAGIDKIDVLVTDDNADRHILSDLQNKGLKILIAESE